MRLWHPGHNQNLQHNTPFHTFSNSRAAIFRSEVWKGVLLFGNQELEVAIKVVHLKRVGLEPALVRRSFHQLEAADRDSGSSGGMHACLPLLCV